MRFESYFAFFIILLDLLSSHTTTAKFLDNSNSYISGVHYYLYTRKNPTPTEISTTLPTVPNSYGFIPNAPMKILIHGWFGGYNHTFPKNVLGAYLNQTSAADINIIVVDWSVLADVHSYPNAVRNVKGVARQTSDFIAFLIQSNITKVDSIHIIGHSLGAHVSGIAGNLVKQSVGTIARITGLDPAKPLFELAKSQHRIDSSAASFVDIIHTTGLTLGVFLPLGHADFYPNGGISQPGCGDNLHCDHARAHMYYAESINTPTGFKACKCSSLLKMQRKSCTCIVGDEGRDNMGEFAATSARGQFYLTTNDNPPFAQG